MTKNLTGVLRATALVIGAAVATGCASVTTEQLEEVRAAAQAAQNAANSAQQAADRAVQAVQGAQSTANQALQAAQAAQACCDATNQRVDRMFDELQRK
jgi:hypothetical protein